MSICCPGCGPPGSPPGSPAGDDAGDQPAPQHLRRGRRCQRRVFYQVARRAVSAGFIAFLAQLLAAHPAAPVGAVVCDNVIIHHSKLVNRWLAAHPRVRVLHGARYSPHDNPTERIWGALKAWLANSPTLTIQGRLRQVHAFFRARSPAQLLATAAPASSPWLPEDYVQNFRQAA
jgi:transposase